MSKVVGAPDIQVLDDPGSLVAGLSESKVVLIHNPLPDDFAVIYARASTQSAPLTEEERRIRNLAGLPMTKEGNVTGSFQSQRLIFKSGDTRNFPGDIAQILVRRMVTYILQTRNDGNDKPRVADPAARREVEELLVHKISDSFNVLNEMSVQEYTEKQLDELNPQAETKTEEPEEAFPADAPNPPPGKGANYVTKPKAKV